ncbi:MAG: radical SAM protein [Candidatus Bathyarchaeota archaeon]|nr:radical SAM protein [Candidatus Bathyarchaeota archaeon]
MHPYLRYALRYIHSRFVTGRPIILTHALTHRCNSRCKICDIWRSPPNGDEMTTGEVEWMLDEAWAQNFVAYVALGGEPMLRDDTPEILAYAKGRGFYTSLITNGTRLAEEATLSDLDGGVSFTVVRPSGAGFWRGRKSVKGRLSWAGLALSFDDPGEIRYTVRISGDHAHA